MSNSTGEMPFLDHLEELRKRILFSLAAIMVGFGLGYWITTHFKLIKVIAAPIAGRVAGGKLVVSSPTDPFMIVLKFAFILGLVLASPFILYQVWLFLAPALTQREKKAIVPSLGIGLVLFLAGAALGWITVVTPAVEWLLNYQSDSFNPLITYQSYMQLVVHVLVGMGIAAELPLVMIVLSLLGVLSYRVYKKFRRYAFFLAFVGGAILAPTPEITMMILFTIPLLLLYEVGVAGAWLVERRRARAARIAAGMVLLGLCFAPARASAQFPPSAPPQQRPTAGALPQRIDTSAMKRLGLPSARKPMPPPDSIMQALLARKGFGTTRYMADSVSFVVNGERILLHGNAATLRDDGQLEADEISYDGRNCLMRADGTPRMFQQGQQPMIGDPMTFITCGDSARAMIGSAFTALAERGANWFMRGNLAVDSGGKRLYGANTSFTSCDLPDPHYHFESGKVKWVSQSIIVARPAVLYIRDVPVLWIPFIFQDTKRDRSSGILIPRFGINDIIRTDRRYNRAVTNIGYYWAPNDYVDVTASLDWFSNRYTQVSSMLNYRWLDRFVTGSLTLRKQFESTGSTSNVLQWNHDQRFNATTSIHFNLNYQSNSLIQLNNAVDPLASTRNITSSLNAQKRYAWGLVSIGGTRSQALGGGAGQMSFPSLTISPKSFSLGPNVTISPNLSVTNSTTFSNPLTLPRVLGFTGIDSLGTASTFRTRNTSVSLTFPTELFHFNLANSAQYTDQVYVGRKAVTITVPNPATNGADSITTTTIRGGDYLTGFNFETGLNLPLILRSTYKITPSIGMTNITTGPLFLRSAASNGKWVAQGKKIQVGLSASPTWFGISNGGLGPFSKFRYTFAPQMSVRWSPTAKVSDEYAKASGALGGLGLADVPASTLVSVSLHQVIEGKVRQAAKDTNRDPAYLLTLPKRQIISLSTSSIGYDFEQAKLKGHSGWTTGAITNSFTSDLVPGLNVSTTHDLFEGAFSSDTAKFSPFLTSANVSFSVTGRTFRPLARLFGLVKKDSVPGPTTPNPAASLASSSPFALAPSPYRNGAGLAGGLPRAGFSASVTYTLSRQRPFGAPTLPQSTEPGGVNPLDPFGLGTLIPITTPLPAKQVGLTTSFSPTQFWTVSWTTNYDITAHKFQSHQIHLQRDLHDWRAAFDFTKGPNGNFMLLFSMYLVNLPDLKFDYNQTTLQQASGQP